VIARLVVDGWAALHSVQRGGAWVPSSMYQLQQPTQQRPVYQLHIIPRGTIIDSEF